MGVAKVRFGAKPQEITMSDFDDAYDRLISSAQALVGTAEAGREEARKVYEGEIKPPEDCPSAAILVSTILNGVRGKEIEVDAAVEDIIQAVAKKHP